MVFGQRVRTSDYKMNRFWGSHVRPGDYSSQNCLISLEAAKRIDLNVLTTLKNYNYVK